MKRAEASLHPEDFPVGFQNLLKGARIFDSSCSPDARVWFIDQDEGFFLKAAAPGALAREAEMTSFFHSRGLSAPVIAYESGEQDYLLTARVPGEDCLDPAYLRDPARLCDTTAELLRQLHDSPTDGCPVPNRTEEYLALAHRNYREGRFDKSLFPDNWGYASPEEAFQALSSLGGELKADTLLHGDYCLPNILLSNWQFSGFIDLGAAGLGDRHVDLHWGIWSLQFNLKTDHYRSRFLDAYGRDQVQQELLQAVAAAEVFL